jgi:tetratricopeptide (TPR) repeat protein
MDCLRELLEDYGQWPPEWQNSLAGAYIGRGIARSSRGDAEGALTDLDKAVALMGSLRERLEPAGQWPPEWQSDLARAHMNRAIARSSRGDAEGALTDLDKAIALMGSLRERLEPAGQWLPVWQATLDKIRKNHRIALERRARIGLPFAGGAPSRLNPPFPTNSPERGAESRSDPTTVLQQVRVLLQANQPGQALALIEESRLFTPEVRNAQGVCLLRLGNHERALMIFRELVLRGLNLRSDVPLAFRTNYATALLADGNLVGCESALADIERQGDVNEAWRALKECIRRWRASLSFLDKVKTAALGVRKPIPMDFALGELVP